MSEKTQKATPYKLQKARGKGQVSKSIELTTCLSMLVFLGMMTALWSKTILDIEHLQRYLLLHASNLQWNLDDINKLHQLIFIKLTNWWLPFALAGGLVTVLSTMAQTGLVWSTTLLTPDFKRLNPVQGFKKLFSLKPCFDAFKNLFKLSLAFLLLFVVLKQAIGSILLLGLTAPTEAPRLFMHFLLSSLFQLLLVLSLIALIDKGYTLWKYQKDQRMSKQEVKDEHKQREGDPKIKAKIKQLQQQLRQKTASLQQVKNADVVITNPTHLAVALQYDRALMPAPKVICKVSGEMVLSVKKIAQKHHIPVLENKAFARALYQNIALNQCISHDLYPIAAGIFRDIYKQRALA